MVEQQQQLTWPEILATLHSTLQTHSYATKLQEYCQKLQLGDPVYNVAQLKSGDEFSCTITIAGVPYTGAIAANEKEAKNSASVEFAMQLLHLSEYINLLWVYI